MLKKVSCLTTLAVTLPPPGHSVLGLKPLGSGGVPVTQWVPHLTPHTSPIHTSFPCWLEPRFPIAESQMSASFPLFNHAAVTAELVPLRRDTAKKEPLGFCPLKSKCATVWGLPDEPLGPVGPECLVTWLEVQVPVPFVVERAGATSWSLTWGSSLYHSQDQPTAPTAAAP